MSNQLNICYLARISNVYLEEREKKRRRIRKSKQRKCMILVYTCIHRTKFVCAQQAVSVIFFSVYSFAEKNVD
jgi:hypothetical protein